MNIFAEVECQLSCNHAVLRIKKMLHALHVIFISILLKSRSEFMGHQTREMLHTRLIRTCLPLIEKWAFVLNSFISPFEHYWGLEKNEVGILFSAGVKTTKVNNLVKREGGKKECFSWQEA